jgi:hypothetical protein
MTLRSTDPFSDAVAAFVAVVWLGMLLGVSFLATPVKFQAPSLERPVALEVGRVTFTAFAKVEWGLAFLLGIAVLFPRAPRAKILFAAVAVLIVALQALWLLPVLDARIDAVIAGEPMSPSMHHMLYAAMEAVKAAALAAVALVALFRLGWCEKLEKIVK